MSVIVVATISPLEEHYAEVVASFQEAIRQTHAEDEGCELYALHEGDHRLVMIEKWASLEALQAHNRAAALQTLRAALDGKVAGAIDVQVLRPLPAGTEQQGTL